MIAERLDFLMNVTNTKNSVLARALVVDQSYVSKARKGKRKLSRNQTFVNRAADYFARTITEDYQKSIILREMHLDRDWPDAESEVKELLYDWLQNSSASQLPLERLLSAMTAPTEQLCFPEVEYPVIKAKKEEAAFYFGKAGKRDGVIAFLNALCNSGKPHTLLLHSDESMEWLYEDNSFAQMWAMLLGKLIQNGSRVKIIHSIGRDANEMWEAVQKWLPLYRSGAIEPYFYPRLRDGIYHRTLFIAAGHSALVSTSVQGQPDGALNILLDDNKSVRALEKEFGTYLALCRPLMESIYPSSLDELAPLIQSFVTAPGKGLTSFVNDTVICVKEGFGGLIAKVEPAYVLFSFREPRMIAAIEEYMKNLPDGVVPDKGSRRLKQLFGLDKR